MISENNNVSLLTIIQVIINSKTSPGATPQLPIQLQELREKKGNCSHMPPRTSMANITAHVLPSGDGEKMKINHPTNDARPFFRQTQKRNLITNPPFTWKVDQGTKMSLANITAHVLPSGMVSRWKLATLQMTQGHPSGRKSLHGHLHMTQPYPTEWVFMGALARLDPTRPTQTSLHGHTHMTKRKAQGRERQTSCTNMYKAQPESQLSNFNTGSCGRVRPHTEQPDQTSLHRCPWMTRSNKFTRFPFNDPRKRVYMNALK